MLEETGLDFVPESLVAVETASKAWFRFILTGTTVGGILKTPAQADSESLQAKWVKDVNSLSLRFVHLLNFGSCINSIKKNESINYLQSNPL